MDMHPEPPDEPVITLDQLGIALLAAAATLLALVLGVRRWMRVDGCPA